MSEMVERRDGTCFPIPDGMNGYGPDHPDYPNAPKDWDERPYLCRDGKEYWMNGYGWRWGEGCWNQIADWDRVAYTPKIEE